MKNTSIKTIIAILLISTIYSCTKSSCRTCYLESDSSITYEVCEDKISTFHNGVLFTESVNSVPVHISVISLEASGAKCN